MQSIENGDDLLQPETAGGWAGGWAWGWGDQDSNDENWPEKIVKVDQT